jgi:uncharacterized membrane protein
MIRIALVFAIGCTAQAMPIEEYPCPPGGTQLTYESFGEEMLATHCNRCHSATPGKRSGAPEAYRFDSVDDVRKHKDRIFVRSAASNTTMPPGLGDPSAEEREQLAEWLACGAP